MKLSTEHEWKSKNATDVDLAPGKKKKAKRNLDEIGKKFELGVAGALHGRHK